MRLITLFCTLLLSAPRVSSDTLTWLTDNNEDLEFVNTTQSQSIALDTVNLILRHLDSYAVEFEVASISRIEYQLRNTEDQCVINRAYTPQRTDYSYYTLPVSMHPMPVLFFLKDRVNVPEHTVTPKGQLRSLAALMAANPGKKVAVLEASSYGSDIDAEIASLDKAFVEIINVDNRYQMGAKLILDNLIDFTIENPIQFKKKLVELNDADKVDALQFATSKPYVIGYIACSKTAQGKVIVDEINRILRQLYSTDVFYNTHFKFIDSRASHLYEPAFRQVFQ